MRRLLAVALAVVVGWSLSMAGVGPTSWDKYIAPGIDDQGGPDGFGYIWKDSNEPGGPTYNWVDISTTGTLVTGLGDDNYVGPFNFGFPFHYYWYDVLEYYIGSNGYIKFGTPYNMAQPFPATIPLTAVPNDFLAVYIADWWPGSAGGQVYRWTNDADSCIISFVAIHPWVGPGVTDGPHTFQVIMTDTDSSITYQYGTQQGTVSNSDLLIGIEANNGQVGLLHSFDAYVPQNDFTIKFYYPDSVTYEVHDLAAEASCNENSQGFFLQVGESYAPWAKVANLGNQSETTYDARFRIQQAGGGVVYDQTVTGGPIVPGEEQEITYLQTWTPTMEGQYFMNLNVNLQGDLNPNNNNKTTENHVLVLPGTMLYDDGTGEQYWGWEGGTGGMAQHFVPPVYPAKIDSLNFNVDAPGTPPLPFTAQILDDDGPGGTPGSVMFSQDLTSVAQGFYGVNTEANNIIITSGSFYVAWMMNGTGTPAIGLDQAPLPSGLGSRQCWEYTGVWAPFRNMETDDAIIRAKISEYQGNLPPEITDYGPMDVDTVDVGTTVTFWASATDPESDPLTWEWRLDGSVVGTDTTVDITFNNEGSYEVVGWVSDGELADSVIWDITCLTLGVINGPQAIPLEYALYDAHPNPFNPSTTIAYSLPRASTVRMTVYDLTGREVQTLVSGWRPAGVYQEVFDATGLSSGVYLIRLEAGTFSASKMVVMMK